MDHLPHSLAALALAALLGAGAASAQVPAPGTPSVPVTRSLWFDAAALADDEVRAGVEAFTAGRFTLGASLGYSHTAHPRDQFPIAYAGTVRQIAIYPACDPRMLMLCGGPAYYGDAQRYRAWTAALTVRFHPAAFSFRNGASRMLVYAGAHAGFRWSTWEESGYYSCTTFCPPYPYLAADSVIVMPPYPYPGPGFLNPIRHSQGGFEPGLDAGVRLLPFGPLFVEVGGRFTLVTADDAMRRTSPGDVESRLVLAAGLAW